MNKRQQTRSDLSGAAPDDRFPRQRLSLLPVRGQFEMKGALPEPGKDLLRPAAAESPGVPKSMRVYRE
ncbi:MAG: hypothetical protein PVI71_02590 [Desulfobacterales bacterium]